MKPIWIVDDDQSIRFVLEKALLRENLPTRSFTNAQDVLKALNETTEADGPQILVSDIRMPGASGLELLEKVKERFPGLPVIIMTAFSALEGRDGAVQVGEGGHDDDRQARVAFLDLLQQVKAGSTRHADIAHQDLRPFGLRGVGQGLQHVLGVGEAAGGQVLAQQRFFQHEADRLVVIHYPDRLHVWGVPSCGAWSLSMRSRATESRF